MVSMVVKRKSMLKDLKPYYIGTTNLFRKLRQEESAAKKAKAKKLLIFAHLLLPYHANGCAICLPISIGTVRL